MAETWRDTNIGTEGNGRKGNVTNFGLSKDTQFILLPVSDNDVRLLDLLDALKSSADEDTIDPLVDKGPSIGTRQ